MVGKIIYLRQHYHFGPHEIAMYLKRYHDLVEQDMDDRPSHLMRTVPMWSLRLEP